MLVCLPLEESRDGTGNNADIWQNIVKPVRSGINHSLSKLFSTRIALAVEVNNFRNFSQEFCFVGHGFSGND